MYKLSITCDNGNRFLSCKELHDKAQAEKFKKQLQTAIKDAKFEILEFCDRCGLEKPIYVRGICKECYETLQKQSPCYDCNNEYVDACATCWVTAGDRE